MRTSGAITHALHQLVYAGLIDGSPTTTTAAVFSGRALTLGSTLSIESVRSICDDAHASRRRPRKNKRPRASAPQLLIAFERDQASPEPRR